MSKILCIATNLQEDVELVGTIGLLRRAGIEVDIYSLHGTSIKCKYGFELTNLKDISTLDYSKYENLFIAGGPAYVELEKSPIVIEIIHHFMKNNKLVAAICAIPTILGHLGYLKNKKYTCFKSMNEDFGGTFVDEYAVKDGNLITGVSVAGVIDFALLIVETLKGKEVADKLKSAIYY